MEKETQRKKDEVVKLATITAAAPMTSAVLETPVVESISHDISVGEGLNGNAVTNGAINDLETASTVLSADQSGLKEPSATEAQMDIPRPSIEVRTLICRS